MYEDLTEILKYGKKIVFFGGAGVSTESNIPDFRSASGIYNQDLDISYSPEQVISHSFFMSNPEFFYEFYKDKMLFPDAEPNSAHKSLAKMEKDGKLLAIITQNIDGLHQKAGSKNVLELHGTTLKNYCTDCNKNYDLDYVIKSEGVPRCKECGGIVRPDVVLYEESLDTDTIQQSIKYIQQADILIVGGTSLIVYPAAGLINYFNGDKLILINKNKTSRDGQADLVINDSIGKVFSICYPAD